MTIQVECQSIYFTKLTFVTVESGVALPAAALEGLRASAVHAAGQAHAPRAVWAEPPELARARVGSGAVTLTSHVFNSMLLYALCITVTKRDVS